MISDSWDSVNVWNSDAALQTCWLDCEDDPTNAYKYPGRDQDFTYIKGYRDDSTRGEWYDHVLFFSCLDGCRSHYSGKRRLLILVPSLVIASVILLLIFCFICRECPLARWWRGRGQPTKQQIAPRPDPTPILVSTIGGPANQYLGLHRRRESTVARKLHSLETTNIMAPPAAQYNPGGWVGVKDAWIQGLESVPESAERQVKSERKSAEDKKQHSGRKKHSKSGKVKVARY